MDSNISHIWYGYTGRSVIGVAGRAIVCVLSGPAQLDAWQGRAAGYYDGLPAYHPLRHIPRDTFIAAMIAPLAMRDSGKQQAQAFTSLAEVRGFGRIKIIQRVWLPHLLKRLFSFGMMHLSKMR